MRLSSAGLCGILVMLAAAGPARGLWADPPGRLEPQWLGPLMERSFTEYLSSHPYNAPGQVARSFLSAHPEITFGLNARDRRHTLGTWSGRAHRVMLSSDLLEALGVCLGPKEPDPETWHAVIQNVAPILVHEVFHAKFDFDLGPIPTYILEGEPLSAAWVGWFVAEDSHWTEAALQPSKTVFLRDLKIRNPCRASGKAAAGVHDVLSRVYSRDREHLAADFQVVYRYFSEGMPEKISIFSS
ncbi:MAG: hypothetical protein ABIJ56_21400, partial [Pseudomonadota bacterium]